MRDCDCHLSFSHLYSFAHHGHFSPGDRYEIYDRSALPSVPYSVHLHAMPSSTSAGSSPDQLGETFGSEGSEPPTTVLVILTSEMPPNTFTQDPYSLRLNQDQQRDYMFVQNRVYEARVHMSTLGVGPIQWIQKSCLVFGELPE